MVQPGTMLDPGCTKTNDTRMNNTKMNVPSLETSDISMDPYSPCDQDCY